MPRLVPLLLLAACGRSATTAPEARLGTPRVDAHLHLEGAAGVRVLAQADPLDDVRAVFVVGSVRGTFGRSGQPVLTAGGMAPPDPWEGYRSLNDGLLAATADARDHLFVFPIVRGDEADAEALVADYVARGATGLKMFSGNERLKVGDMASADYDPILQAAARHDLPIIDHVSLNFFRDEVVGMVDRHPDVRFVFPHLGFYKEDPGRLGDLLAAHPNVFVDLSQGGPLAEGLLAADAHPEAWEAFLEAWSSRVLWGSDLVLPERAPKDLATVVASRRCLLDLLEGTAPFRCDPIADDLREAGEPADRTFRPLTLSPEVREDLAWRTAARLVPALGDRFGE